MCIAIILQSVSKITQLRPTMKYLGLCGTEQFKYISKCYTIIMHAVELCDSCSQIRQGFYLEILACLRIIICMHTSHFYMRPALAEPFRGEASQGIYCQPPL